MKIEVIARKQEDNTGNIRNVHKIPFDNMRRKYIIMNDGQEVTCNEEYRCKN